MKRYFPYIIVVLTLAGTVWLFHHNREYALHPYSNDWAKDSTSLEALNYKINLESMGLQIPEGIALHTGDTLAAWAKRQERPTLVFRFCEDHCGMCIDHELYMLRKYMNDYADDIVFLASYSKNLFPKIGTIKKIRHLMYNVDREALNWPIEGFSAPYYFVVHPDGRVSDFYLPDKGYEESGRQYLEGVKRIIGKRNIPDSH